MAQKSKCKTCGTRKPENEGRFVDGEFFCNSCLFKQNEPFPFYPIGTVHNNLKRGKSFHLKGDRSQISEIELFESQRPFLYKLEDEKHLTVVYYPHDQQKIASTFRRGLDGKKVGIYASRTPFRLNPISITECKLVKIEDAKIFVRGLDAIDGSPVLDIKLGRKAIEK